MGNESVTMADVCDWEQTPRGVDFRVARIEGESDTLATVHRAGIGWVVYRPGHSTDLFASGPETGAAGRALADAALARMLGEAAPEPEGAIVYAGATDLGPIPLRDPADIFRETADALTTALRELDEARAALARLLDAATDVYVLACETDQIGPDYDRSEYLLGTLSNAIDLARSGGPL